MVPSGGSFILIGLMTGQNQNPNQSLFKHCVCLPLQAIQDITRNRDIDPEEIVTLIYEKIDVKGEGKNGVPLPVQNRTGMVLDL